MPEVIRKQKTIALVAHDKKKEEMTQWAVNNKEKLSTHKLVATGTTGKLLESELSLPIEKLLSGPLGGDQQLGAMIAEGKLDMVLFFWDPLESQPHDSDVKALIRIAVTWNILLACDTTTADFILTSPLMEQDYQVKVPDHQNK